MRSWLILSLLPLAACSATQNAPPAAPELEAYVPQNAQPKAVPPKQASGKTSGFSRQKVAVFPGRTVEDLQAGIDQIITCWRDDPRFYGLAPNRTPDGFAFGGAGTGLEAHIIRLTKKNLAITLTGPKYSKYLEAEMSLAMRGKPVCQGQ